jgi:hypothetical protein
LCNWDHRHVPPYLAYMLKWDLVNFLCSLTSNLCPLHLCLLSSWYYSHEPPHPTVYCSNQ